MGRPQSTVVAYLPQAILTLALSLALAACAGSAPPVGTASAQPRASEAEPTPVPETAPRAEPTRGAIAATEEADTVLENVHWLGHAAFKLGGEKVIYLDPWQLKEAEPADIILITHGHSDHCSPEDVARIRGPQTTVVTTADCADKLGGKVQVVGPGERLTVQGVAIETVPAYNLNKQFHPREQNWVGYIVTLNGIRIYHAGDSDHTPEMDAVKADVALLPVGGKYTMTAEEAAAAANAIQPRVAVPMHWGAVVGSRQDAERFQELCKAPVRIMEQGG